jgi:hypothetical protein
MEISFDQLPKAVSSLYDKLENIERLLQSKSDNSSDESDQLLSSRQAAAFLNISINTLYSWNSSGNLPFMKVSKQCYYLKADLLSFLKNAKQQTNQDRQKATDSYLTFKNRKN